MTTDETDEIELLIKKLWKQISPATREDMCRDSFNIGARMVFETEFKWKEKQ